VINVTYGNAGSMLGTDGVVNIGTLTNSGNNVETMNLTFSDVGADDTVNVADIIVGANGAGNSALRTITVTSDSRVNLGTGGATLAELDDLTLFDASGVKGALVVTLGDLATNASATVKTGGAGNSTVVVNKAVDAAAAAAPSNTTLTVDASAGTGNQNFTVTNLDADLLNATTANFVFVGGAGNDTLTLTSAGGSLNNISGGKGADIITLTTSAGVDRLAFNVGDSVGADRDTVTGFKVGGADVIDLRNFGFDLALQSVTAAGAALNGTANEFGGRAVAAFDGGANSTVYVDVNGDNKLDANDLVISFVGNTGASAIVNADILWA
jgi:Ca2+-binding RTX toxin-like protein